MRLAGGGAASHRTCWVDGLYGRKVGVIEGQLTVAPASSAGTQRRR